MNNFPVSTINSLQTFVSALAEYGEKTAVVALHKSDMETWSFARLVNTAQRLAAGLRKAGLPPGALVLLCAPNSPEWLVACFALLTMNAVPVVVDTQLTEEDLRHVLDDSEVQWALTTLHLARRLAKYRDNQRLTCILLDAEKDDRRSWRNYEADPKDPFPSANPADPAVLFYTSGTTGAPKGVPLTHRNLTANLQAFLKLHLIKDTDRFLLPLPLHHVYPFTVGMLAPLAAGIALVFPRSLTGPQIVRALQVAHVTVIIGVPRFYAALYAAIEARVRQRGWLATTFFQRALACSIALRRRFGLYIGKQLFASFHKQFAPHLRAVCSGGAALDPDLAWKLEGLGWQTAGGYGLTETSPILTFNPPGTGRIGAAGLPLPGVQLRVATPEGQSQYGEVQAAGPNVFTGYRHLPEKTRASFTSDGYFRTGDLGYFDKNGYLHLVGRASSMIVMPNGENVWPEEVEEALSRSEYIREAGVFEQNGRLLALLAPEDALRASLHDSQEVRERIRSAVEQQMRQLPSHHRITAYAITSTPLPRTHLGKIRRYQLAELYRQATQQGYQPAVTIGPIPISQLTPDDQHLLDDSTARAVWEWLGQRFPHTRLAPDTHLHLDLEVDSLAWLHLTLELRERLGLILPEEAIARIETVRDLLRETIEAEQAPPGETQPLALFQHPEALLSPAQQQWLSPPGRIVSFLSACLARLNRAVIRWFFKLEVRGLEHLPQHGPFLLTPNHVSLLDPPALAAALPLERLARTYWGGWTGIMFTSPFMRLVSRAARVVPVDPVKGPLSSLAFGVAALKNGANLVWFPEGGRSRNGKLQRFRPGIGLILQAQPVPLVPVWIAGAYEALPYGQRWPRRRQIIITFGAPLDPDELQQFGEGEQSPERIANVLYNAVAALGAAAFVRG